MSERTGKNKQPVAGEKFDSGSQGLRTWLPYGAHMNFRFHLGMIYTLDVMSVFGRNKQNGFFLIGLHLMNIQTEIEREIKKQRRKIRLRNIPYSGEQEMSRNR